MLLLGRIVVVFSKESSSGDRIHFVARHKEMAKSWRKRVEAFFNIILIIDDTASQTVKIVLY